MEITKTSMFSGIEHTVDLPVTATEIRAWKEGKLVQNVFPDLTRAQREFIITGITEDEWQEYCDAMEEMYSE